MITKTAITIKQLRGIVDGPVAKRINRDASSVVQNQINRGFPGSTHPFAVKRTDAFVGGKLNTHDGRLSSPAGGLNKRQAEAFIKPNRSLPKSDQNKIFVPNDWDDSILPKMYGIDNMSPKARRATNDIVLTHELEELKGGNRAVRALRKGKDTMTTTGHAHPEVLFREHNMLSSLDLKGKDKKDVIDQFRRMRGSPGPAGKDLEALDNVLAPFGGYGNGIRINRSARKHLTDKLLKQYETKEGPVKRFFKDHFGRNLSLGLGLGKPLW